jgi:hypothetical protein
MKKPYKCECGREIKVFRQVRQKSSRSSRKRIPIKIKDHDLCDKCWKKIIDSQTFQN